MTAANNNINGFSFTGSDPMNLSPGPNTAPNSTGIPNVPNHFICGGNEQNLGTIRVTTEDSGSAVGVASGTHSAHMQPMQGSEKYFSHGLPVTRQGDMSLTNNNNAVVSQIAPSNCKCFVNC